MPDPGLTGEIPSSHRILCIYISHLYDERNTIGMVRWIKLFVDSYWLICSDGTEERLYSTSPLSPRADRWAKKSHINNGWSLSCLSAPGLAGEVLFPIYTGLRNLMTHNLKADKNNDDTEILEIIKISKRSSRISTKWLKFLHAIKSNRGYMKHLCDFD